MDRELVDAGQVGIALAVLSGVGFVLALLLAVLQRGRPSSVLLRGALLSGVLVLVFPAWLVYNAIEDHFGLDSVAALLINLVLFALAGGGVGLALRRIWPHEELPAAQPGAHELSSLQKK